MNKIDVCVSPALYSLHHNPESVVVVVDILRATSAICAAFMNGVKHIIPIGTIDEARACKEKGYMVAAERDGLVLDFADFGNSPFNFTPERVAGRDIVYSTTNGTQAIQMASGAHHVVVGAYFNISALARWIVAQKRDVVILCAGWKNRFSLEDTLYAGALAHQLIGSGAFETICDATNAALDLWQVAHHDLQNYVLKAAQKARLAKHGLDDVIDYCHTPDLSNIIPLLDGERLVPVEA
ncbi:2-phosphosulfolactate phosphatase [Breznakibacter xylanolyticus]|uniref:Probable 2-phosphosulfolactate phosphatase n=1 Tax=Breznakibacter xylanolyticus TaxID=990 RepID=A0A2W7P4U7_9BACT|nr:2-phosphosulfolactate phosphatase [Breznakibacter xylanolyticus]PZX20376.1 2-phosphosulfolactate phosphatase [Breznakibacter xylanolyticus]